MATSPHTRTLPENHRLPWFALGLALILATSAAAFVVVLTCTAPSGVAVHRLAEACS